MRRRLLYVCVLTLLALPPFAAAKSAASWAQAELKAVVAAGLMAKEAAARPNDPLTRGQLETIAAGISHVDPVVPATPATPVTMAALDARLVSALGLTDSAKLFTQAARNAGLAPPSPFGPQVHGGFDCSGFVWRVYKLQRYGDSGPLADTLQGRTSYAMSGEVPAAKRISLPKLQPADVIFFGAKGPKSKPAQVDHMGLYLGNGWFIHSSRYGVALETLTGGYLKRFAWGRRPLAEAGLVSGS
jgi:cell wall-associated NlpC family hydrolase